MRFFGRYRRDRDLAEEIQTHLALAEDDYRRRGMSGEDARNAALRAFGGVLKTRQVYREQSSWRWLEMLRQDARFGLRVVLRDRAFALTAILVLGLGIGVNNMQFTILYAHTLRGLPIDDAGRVLIGSLVDERGTDRGVSFAEYQDLRADASLVSDLAAFGAQASVALGDRGRAPDRYLAVYTTGNAFEILRVSLLMGRSFSSEEQQPGGPRVAILGARAWRARYQADPTILGREVLINGEAARVIGVLPADSGFPSTAEVLMPVSQAPNIAPVRGDMRTLRAFGRVRDDASIDEAAAQLRTRLTHAARVGGDTARGLLPSVAPISVRFRGRATDPAWMAFFAVGFLVVAVASANAANLMITRGVRRTREIAIRGSLGASRGRVVIQLLVESLVLATLGGGMGLVVSIAGVRLFQAGVPVSEMPYWWRYSMDLTVFIALVLVSFATVLIFGLVPALQTSKADVARVLKDGGWSGTGRRSGRWLTTTFMVLQLALSVVLMAHVSMSLGDDDAVPSDRLIARSDVVTAALSLPSDRYPTAAERAAFFRHLEERMRALPGVESAALTNLLPTNGATERRLQLTAGDPPEQMPSVWTVYVGSGYFDVLGLPLVRGRDPGAPEPSDGPVPVIVNERFAGMFFPSADPIGQQMTLVAPNPRDGTPKPVTIVAVAQDIRHRFGVHDPVVYLPLSEAAPPLVSLMVRSRIDAAATTAQLREGVFGLDPNLPVFQASTLARVVHEAGWNARASSRLVTALSLIVMLLSTVGLYAVTAHVVSQRAKEIGIRLAVGAQPAQIGRMVLGSSALYVSLGLTVGVLCTLAWDGVFGSGLVNIRLADPAVLGPVITVLALVAFAACLAPARRATRLDPVATLRQD